jgi:small-conductance mechanosensitive channel
LYVIPPALISSFSAFCVFFQKADLATDLLASQHAAFRSQVQSLETQLQQSLAAGTAAVASASSPSNGSTEQQQLRSALEGSETRAQQFKAKIDQLTQHSTQVELE